MSLAAKLGPHDGGQILLQGTEQVDEGTRSFLLLHGRGASAEEILGLGRELAATPGFADAVLMAPQGAQGTWYPGSFLEPLERNEPWLSSALGVVEGCSVQLAEMGVSFERQVLVGFSQGACLASEYVARHPRRYGGLLAFTGGVLGPLGETRSFDGDLSGTPALLSTGDPDPHVPLVRVRETAALFEEMGARVEMRSYPGRPHIILPEELRSAVNLLSFG